MELLGHWDTQSCSSFEVNLIQLSHIRTGSVHVDVDMAQWAHYPRTMGWVLKWPKPSLTRENNNPT
jgi:hypothetical protein